jgi:uncharacterized SAM-binding protein YcdF (DUF218 family)
MFIFLSKFGPPFLYPLGLIFLLLILALIIRRRPRLQTVVIVTALVILLLGSNKLVSSALARSLEWRYLPQASYPKVDAIVVLGGGTEPAQYPRPAVEVNAAGDRVIYAARLYKQGVAPHLLLSGGYITWLSSRSEDGSGGDGEVGSIPPGSTNSSTPATEMADLLGLMGVPADALWLQPKSQNTYEDALYSAEILRANGIKRIVLVTSAIHMPRSVALFEKQGFEVIPAPADYTITDANWKVLLSLNPATLLVNLVPNVGSLSLTSNALKEYLGIFVYHLRGWL